jgi:hypothetical protein
MDNIVEMAGLAKTRPFNPIIAIFGAMEDKLKGAPRFLLDTNAIHTATELTFGRPKVLLEAMAHCHIPYSKMWVEWEESGRENLRRRFPDAVINEPGRPIPVRVGFFLECEKGGRKGQVTWAWESPIMDGLQISKDLNPANIAPISAYFNLDQRIKQPIENTLGLSIANLARLWTDNPIQKEALFQIWETAEHSPNRWGEMFLNRNPHQREAAYADVYGEYITVWAIMMLLTASRPIVHYTPVDQSKLNKARVKRHEVPRLDHTRVTIHLNAAERAQQIRTPLGFTRKSPRIHMVSRYLARRGNKHWIVEPYMRGQGETISRHIKVRQ